MRCLARVYFTYGTEHQLRLTGDFKTPTPSSCLLASKLSLPESFGSESRLALQKIAAHYVGLCLAPSLNMETVLYKIFGVVLMLSGPFACKARKQSDVESLRKA